MRRMKNNRYKHMKRRIIIKSSFFLLLVCCSVSALGQQKETRKERKIREKKEQMVRFETAGKLVNDSTFMIIGERITSKKGLGAYVNGTLNFIKVSKDKAVIQVAPNHSTNLGPNGLGGITIKGRILKYEIKENKKNIFIRMSIQGSATSAQITIALTGDNYASANVAATFSSAAFTLYGKLKQLNERLVFEGQGY